MSWQILVAISVITYSVSVLLQRILLKDSQVDPIAFSIVFQLFTGILIFLYALARGFSTPNLTSILPNLALMIFLYGLGNVLIFKALKTVEASEFTIVFATRSLWTILVAVLFLRESFLPKQFLGTGLILLSVILVSWQKKIGLNLGILISLFAAIIFGVAFANDAFIVRNFDAPSYLAIAFILPSLSVWAVTPASTNKIKSMITKDFLLKLSLLGVIYAISAITIFLAYQAGRNAAQISSLAQSATIVTVILAIIFLKEKTRLAPKIIGAISSFIGIILVG